MGFRIVFVNCLCFGHNFQGWRVNRTDSGFPAITDLFQNVNVPPIIQTMVCLSCTLSIFATEYKHIFYQVKILYIRQPLIYALSSDFT